jgi:hypothetical protein
MVGFGALLIILGLGSLLLPMFDIQFRIMSLLDDYQPIAGIGVALIGAVLVVTGSRSRSRTVVVTPAAPAASAPPAASPPPAQDPPSS